MLALLAGPALVPQPPLLASRPAVARTSSIVAGDKLEPFDVKPFVKFTGRAKNRAERKQLYNSAGSFPPRTSNLPGEGYFFFQNSSPKTGVQKDLPGFFTAENFADAELDPKALPVLGVGAVCAAIIAGSTIEGTKSLPARTAPPPAVEKKAEAPKISLPKIEAPKISAPKAAPRRTPPKPKPPKPRRRPPPKPKRRSPKRRRRRRSRGGARGEAAPAPAPRRPPRRRRRPPARRRRRRARCRRSMARNLRTSIATS